MTRKLFLLAAIAVVISLVSCEKNDSKVSVKVTTLDATEVSYEGYTFNAEAVIKGLSSSAIGEIGVYYGSSPNVSKDNKFLTTEVAQAVNGQNKYSDRDSNAYTFMLNTMYYFDKGETIYYKAYVKIITAEGANYYYGEEKSFVLK